MIDFVLSGITFTVKKEKIKMEGKLDMARNPNTPPDTLRKLAEDEDLVVRAAIVRNPNTPVDIIARLALRGLGD